MPFTSDLIWKGRLLVSLGHFLDGAHWTELDLLSDVLGCWDRYRKDTSGRYLTNQISRTALMNALVDALWGDDKLYQPEKLFLSDALEVAANPLYKHRFHEARELLTNWMKAQREREERAKKAEATKPRPVAVKAKTPRKARAKKAA